MKKCFDINKHINTNWAQTAKPGHNTIQQANNKSITYNKYDANVHVMHWYKEKM